MEGLLVTRTPSSGGPGTNTNGVGGVTGSGGAAGGINNMNSITTIGSRSTSASSAERSLLLGALATHMGVLDARENDAQTIIRKSELWDEITRQFNAHTLQPRSRQQIQTLYKNMKAKARRYEARLAEVASGVPPPEPDPISEMLLGLLHQQMQHQRHHLQRLAALETFNHAHTPPLHSPPPLDDGVKTFNNNNLDPLILTPEQVMQVSLEEGLATEMDMKNDPLNTTGVTHSGNHLQKDGEEEEEDEDDEEEEDEEEGGGSEQENPSNMFPGLPNSLSDQQQQHHHYQQQGGGGSGPRLPLTSGQNLNSSLKMQPSKPPLSNPFQNSIFPHTTPLPFRSPLGNNQIGELLHSTKRPRLETLGDAGRLRGCGAGLSSRLINSHCCCPELHAALASQAEREHQLRVKALTRESEAMAEEHAVRMRILSLEEEVLRVKLGNAARGKCDDKQCDDDDDGGGD